MARGNARGATRRPAAGGSKVPGWLWLFTGIAVGLFAAFLLHLAQVQREQKSAAPDAKAAAAPAKGKAQDKALPKFDFYAVLPKMEVILPREDDEPARPAAKPASQAEQKKQDKTAGAPAGQTSTPASEQGRFMLQAGSFRNSADAERLRAEYTLDGFNVRVQPGVLDNGDTWYRVMIGPFGNKTDLRNAQTRLAAKHVDALPIQLKD